MSAVYRVALVAFGAALCAPLPARAAEKVGEAVLIKTSVTGQNGAIEVKSPVHRNERIRTSKSGLGQFVFRDGTRLAVGWGSTVTIDKFVFDDEDSVKKLTIRATKGTFRWISGTSKSTAYEIRTPAGTIGVRGTAFDFFVAPNGMTAMVLLSGSARFCGSNGCKDLNRRCESVIAKPRGGVSDPKRVSGDILTQMGNRNALPFLSGSQELTRDFRRATGGCSLRTVSFSDGDSSPPTPRQRSEPAPSPAPAPEPEKPAPPTPEPPKPEPPKQDKPDKPHGHHGGKGGKGGHGGGGGGEGG